MGRGRKIQGEHKERVGRSRKRGEITANKTTGIVERGRERDGEGGDGEKVGAEGGRGRDTGAQKKQAKGGYRGGG